MVKATQCGLRETLLLPALPQTQPIGSCQRLLTQLCPLLPGATQHPLPQHGYPGCPHLGLGPCYSLNGGWYLLSSLLASVLSCISLALMRVLLGILCWFHLALCSGKSPGCWVVGIGEGWHLKQGILGGPVPTFPVPSHLLSGLASSAQVGGLESHCSELVQVCPALLTLAFSPCPTHLALGVASWKEPIMEARPPGVWQSWAGLWWAWLADPASLLLCSLSLSLSLPHPVCLRRLSAGRGEDAWASFPRLVSTVGSAALPA